MSNILQVPSVSQHISNEMLADGRLTSKKFISWLNAEFDRFEIKNYRVIKVERTRFRGQDYEGGACKLIVTFQHIDDSKLQGHFLSFYYLSEYQEYIQSGKYKMILTFNKKKYSLSDLTVDVVKV